MDQGISERDGAPECGGDPPGDRVCAKSGHEPKPQATVSPVVSRPC